jgi:hypothetical protein
MTSTILAPAAVLVAWTMVMMLWVLVTRMIAFTRAGVHLSETDAGSRYVDAEELMPGPVNWKSHNFTHLMEQPTLFYAVICIIALAGGEGTVVSWAWAYTGFRIAHSLWQSLVNRVPVRLFLFLCSNVCLLVLTYQALRLTVLRQF